MINDYNDYILDMLCESIKNDETILVLSEKLEDILSSIEHPIAHKLIKSDFDLSMTNFKVTVLDVNDKKDSQGNPILDSISFMTSNKAIEIACKNLEIDYKKELTEYEKNLIYSEVSKKKFFTLNGRSETSLGRIINKLFPNEFDANKDIEPFVNTYKSLRDVSMFELVKGNDIIYWYNENQYMGGGTLNSSCMRYQHCNEYLTFYSENEDKISLLILKDKDNNEKIRGRAIVWNLDEPSGRTFMDRIYYTNDYIINLFKDYANTNGWLYKKEQNMDESESIIDGNTLDFYEGELIVNGLNNPGSGHYPYMDTMKYFDGDCISNNSDNVEYGYLELVHTDGSAENDENSYYSEYYDRYINTDDYYFCEMGDDYRDDDDCFYSSFYRVYVTNDYADENGVWCDYPDDEWRDDGDYIELSNGKYATEKYAENNFYYSEYSDEWLIDAVYSEEHQTYIDSDCSVQVFTDVNEKETDYRHEDDGTWWTWDHNDEKYDNSVTEEELKEEYGLIKKRVINKHIRKKHNKEINDEHIE